MKSYIELFPQDLITHHNKITPQDALLTLSLRSVHSMSCSFILCCSFSSCSSVYSMCSPSSELPVDCSPAPCSSSVFVNALTSNVSATSGTISVTSAAETSAGRGVTLLDFRLG
uniref:(northern house mosquito) hypothetical protein n=2 Tax=Culex pipiens TaxID=7175 RepID=A0A8D8G6C4_CULPI